MPVTAQQTRFTYTANGVTTTFAYGCRILSASHIQVQVNGVVQTSGYSVTGVNNPSGGNVVFSVAPANGAAIIVERVMPLERATDYQANGDLLEQTLDDDQDAQTMLLQQVNAAVLRAIRAPSSDSATLNDLPVAALRANLLLGFDANGQPQVVSSVAGTATQLALDLANGTNVVLGDALIGVRRSDNLAQTLHAMLEAYTFLRGNQTPVAGGAMRIDLLRESNVVEPLQTMGGIWPLGPVHTHMGVSKEFSNEVVGVAGGPFAAQFVHAVNNNNNADVCALILNATAWTDNDTVFGANIIARNRASTTGTKLVGVEIDVLPATGTTISSNGGALFINAFNIACPIPAIQIGGVGGGTFNNGLVIGGIASAGAGVAGQAGTTMGSLINTGTAIYNQAAIVLSNQHRIRLSGTAAAHAQIYNDGSNNVRAVLGTGAWIFRDNADAVSLASVSNAGGQGVFNIETASGEYRVNGTKVVGARGAAVTAPTGGATIDSQARTAIGDLIARLQAHGLIA